MEGNGRMARKALDASITSARNQCEKTWMLKLRSVYPYCLNDWQRFEYKKDDIYVLVGSLCRSLTGKHNRIACSNFHRNNNSLSPDEVSIKLEHHQ